MSFLFNEYSPTSRKDIPKEDFGVPDKRKYPLDTPEHVKSAAHLINHGHITDAERETLARKIFLRARQMHINTDNMNAVKKVLEQVPPMSNGTSLGNAPPRTMAPYYDESGDELLNRINNSDTSKHSVSLDDIKQIVAKIHDKTEIDSKEPTENQNCQVCTWCVEAQCRGRDVLPRAVYSPRDPLLSISGISIVKNPVKISVRNEDDVVTKVKEAGPGSRFYVHVNWNGSHGGHEFLLMNIGFEVYLIDGQAGFVGKVDSTDYFQNTNYQNSFICRLDNKPLNEALLKDATDDSKSVPWDWKLDIPYMKENNMISDEEYQQAIDSGMYTPESVQEAACATGSAALLNIKNQLSRIVGDEFDFKGGSLVPKFSLISKQKPEVELEVNINGQNVDVTPKFKGIPDTLKKKRNIAIMRAANIIADYAREIVAGYKGVVKEGFEDFKEGLSAFARDVLSTIESSGKEMIPVDDYPFNKVYHGTIDDDGGTGDPLFITPYKGIASIFAARDVVRQRLRDLGVRHYNLSYDEWDEGKTDHVFNVVHVTVETTDGAVFEPFEIASKGYIYSYDISDMKDCVYRYRWMDEEREALLSGCDDLDPGTPEVVYIHYMVKPVDDEDAIQEYATEDGKSLYSMRKATNNDVEFIYFSELETVNENKDDLKVQVYLRKDAKESVGHTKIIMMDGKDIGVYQAYKTDYYGLKEGKRDWWYLAHIYIKPQYRGKGIGSDIIKKDIKEHDKILLQVMKSNVRAKKLYESLGFKVSQKNDHGGLVMRLDNSDKPKSVQQESFIQEGATQDLKNGVNPYSDKLVFHVSPDKHLDGQIWKPRVPEYLDPYNPEEKGFEDNTIPRICFSTSIEGALNGITVNIPRQNPDQFNKMYVYIPEKPWKSYQHKTNKELVKSKLVYDANVTREVWITEPVRMKLYGVIQVDQVSKVKRKSVVPTSKGEKGDRFYYTYKWHWVVKPKVLEKATRFDYSNDNVIEDLCIDMKKFKYGLIRDGKLQTGNVSDADYDKYWVFHSGQTVDEAGGGNCYDMVEYEAGYLDAFGVTYKKYFMNFTKTDGETVINTHTICVVPKNGKFIYLEQAFKRVVDEWGYDRQKTFDSLKDIFQYVADVVAEYENQDVNYGVWDYTDAKIDYGTPIKDFMDYIMKHCKMIHDGEAKMNGVTEEMDMFITIGDSMFYVSEYHNALFDDPDAVEEATTDYGIIIDDSEEIFDEAAKGPYDEYLRLHGYDPKTNTVVRRIRVKDEHGYDPKTNTIIDPNDNTKRVSATKYAYDRKTHSMIDPFGRRRNAGRMGSAKERNRMNKFLRDNDYDPYTSTIATDIPAFDNPDVLDKYKEKDGSRLRIPFTMNPHKDDLYRRPDTFEDVGRINLTPKTIQGKPSQSNFTLKHEEGHASQHNQPYEYSKRRRLADDFIDSIKGKIETAHDLSAKEYDADRYGVLHNKYDKSGKSGEQGLLGYVRDYERWLKQTERRLKLNAKKYAKRSTRADQKIIDILKKYPNNPGPNGKTAEWEKFLYDIDPNGFQGKLKDYIEYWTKCRSIRKEYVAKMKEIEKRLGTNNSDEYDELTDPLSSEMVSKINEVKKEYSQNEMDFLEIHRYIARIQELAKLENMDNWLKTKRDEIASDQFSSMKKGFNKDKYRDPEEMKYAHKKRGEFAKQQWDELQKQKEADAVKKRQLAKEQLKQQIDSGKLTKDQQEKAQRKIQRIEAFEAKKDGKVEQPKPTVKKEGYRVDRFGNRFYFEGKEEESLSDDMENITVGDLNLDDEEDTEKPDNTDKEEDAEDNISISDEELGDEEDPMGLPDYLKGRMSEEDLESFEQPDENISADAADLGSFGKDQSDIQNEYDQKEVTILMKLMASEADAMNEYMDGAKETNVDVLRRLYADIANEERFHMEQLLYAKCELTGEKYVPKDPEVKSEYEELLKMGMDEETAMQTAVDRCHIRGSIADDDTDERIEIQEDIKTMESTLMMFDALLSNTEMVMESKTATAQDVEHAFDVFTECCLVSEATYDVTAAETQKSTLSRGNKFGPIQLIRNTLKFLLNALIALLRKFKEFCNKIRNHSREFRRFVKNYGLGGLIDPKASFYFINLKAPDLVDTALVSYLGVAYDTTKACVTALGFKMPPIPLDPGIDNFRTAKLNVNGNIGRGVDILTGVQLVKSKFVIPEDTDEQARIAQILFGYTDAKGADGRSLNTLNSLQMYIDIWCKFMKQVEGAVEAADTLSQNQNSVYYKNKKKYDEAIKGLETVTKACKAMVSAMQYDINMIVQISNKGVETVRNQDQQYLDQNSKAKSGADYYETNVRNKEPVKPRRFSF